MPFIEYFWSKAKEGNVTLQDVRDLLTELESVASDKVVLDTRTGVVLGKFYVVTKVKYFYGGYVVIADVVIADGAGLIISRGRMLVQDVDDVSDYVEWDIH